MSAVRADVFLVAKGFFASRARARAAILAGAVKVDGRPLSKAGESVSETSVIEVTEPPRYVSRGGEKLAGALDSFGIDVTGKRALDAGASTGGFTDCLLDRGAREVVAIDVGYGQFAWKLRNDPRVSLLERTNIRTVTADGIGGLCDLAVADLSFISLRLVLAGIAGLLESGAPMVVLFKPQFEAGKGRVGKGGIVREPAMHIELLGDFVRWAEGEGLGPLALTVSAPRGADGNVEFFFHLATGAPRMVDDARIVSVVESAHEV